MAETFRERTKALMGSGVLAEQATPLQRQDLAAQPFPGVGRKMGEAGKARLRQSRRQPPAPPAKSTRNTQATAQMKGSRDGLWRFPAAIRSGGQPVHDADEFLHGCNALVEGSPFRRQ